MIKLRHGTKWCTQADGEEIIIELPIIMHQRLNVYVPACVDYFPANL